MSNRSTNTQIDGEKRTPRIPIMMAGISLGSFFAITFVLCVMFDLIVPSMAMREAWMPLLPGFTWKSIPSFVLGLVESFAYGLYAAIVFGSIFNLVVTRFQERT